MYKPLPDGITVKESSVQGLGAFYNHSDNPNCKNVAGFWHQLPVKYLMTVKPIKAGEELTASYSLYNDFDDKGN